MVPILQHLFHSDLCKTVDILGFCLRFTSGYFFRFALGDKEKLYTGLGGRANR